MLSGLFFKYLPFWPMFVITIMISLFGAWFYLRTAVPMYEINASIMLKDETIGARDGATVNSLDQVSEKKIIVNELKVLQSKTLMYDVITRLHLYASYFEDNELIPVSAYTSTPVKIVAGYPQNLKTFKKVDYSFNEKDSQVVIGPNHYPLNQFINTEYGYIKFVPNDKYTHSSERPLYFTLASPQKVLLKFPKLKAIAGRESTVVNLTIDNMDPQEGEDVLNEVISAYDRATLSEKNRLADNTVKFVKERLDAVERELNDINQKKQSYKASQGAVNIGTQGELYLNRVSDNDQKISDINIQLTMLEQVENYVNSKDNSTGIIPSTLGIKDQRLSKLIDDLYETELNYDKLKKTTGENNPILSPIKDKIEKIKPDLLENIKSQKESLEATKQNLFVNNNMYSTMLSSIPQKEKDLIDIDRDLAIKSGIYNFLRQKMEETSLAVVANMPGARVIDTAESSPLPVSPNPVLIYIIAGVFGLVFPAGFITAREMLNRTVLFRTEIEKLTDVPIIGEVIHDKSKNPLVILEGKRTFIAEQFRRIRTSLSFLGINSQKKKILVTSSLSGEGKSFVAANLALSLALTGKKVILLEFDLANPSLSNKLESTQEKGVSNYLWEECEPEEIIRRTDAHDNLFFIPSGPLPENPTELLMSDRVKELLEYLEAIFDHIIIDSAPASLLSDAYVLSPNCDATLYVVKHRFTPKIYLEKLDEQNNVNQLKNMGIIFNGIRSRGFTKNGYGYGYGYGYIHNNNTTTRKKVKKAQY